MTMHTDLAPWLLMSKVTPPRELNKVVSRPTLMTQLDQAANGNIVTISAPGGYGKTSVLREWRTHCETFGQVVCWLSLDDQDDIDSFVAHLSYAVSVALPDVESDLGAMLARNMSGELSSVKFVLSLLARLEREQRKVQIILDNFECLDDTIHTEILPVILARIPENVTLIVASREPVDIGDSELEHRGLVTRFGADDLKFGIREMKLLWQRRLTDRQIRRVALKTEGWPVLVALLLSASDRGLFDVRHIDEVGCKDNAISDYFREEIIARVDVDFLNFLKECSVLDDIRRDVVAEVLGADSVDLFERVKDSSDFFVSTTKCSGGFRQHPMVQTFLRKELLETNPQRFSELQSRAAFWYSARGKHVLACNHALEAENEGLLVEVFENTSALKLLLSEGLVQLRAIDRKLTDKVVGKCPLSAFTRAIIWIKSGRMSDARRLYEETMQRHSERIAADRELHVAAALTRLMLATYSGQMLPEEDIDLIETAVQEASDLGGEFMGFILTFRCVRAHQLAQFNLAADYARRAQAVLRAADCRYGEVYIHLHLGMIEACLTEAPIDKHEFETANELIRKESEYEAGLKYVHDILSIEAMHEENPFNLRYASRLGNILPRLLRSEGWIDIYSGAFRTLSEQSFVAGALSDALHTLDVAKTFSERNSIEALARICDLQKAILTIAAGTASQRLEVETWSAEFDAYDPMLRLSEISWRVVETECELCLLLAHLGHVTVDLEMYADFRDYLLELGQARMACRITALLCLIESGAAREASVAILNHYLLKGRFRRSTLFISGPLSQVLMLNKLTERYRGLTVHLTEQFRRERLTIENNEELSIISEKEKAVLYELRKGHTDKQIAMTLGVTEHAVRYHLKNMYIKLSVRSRRDAINKAVALGVLPELLGV